MIAPTFAPLVLNSETKALVQLALEEDLGPGMSLDGDVTTTPIVPNSLRKTAKILAREELIVCGHELSAYIFKLLDPTADYQILIPDGAKAAPDMVIATVSASLRTLLAAERVSLNFLQRLCGIATKTRKIVGGLPDPKVVLDTRKTTPGMRHLEKYAVRVGGAGNHRFGLFDAVLIKNNHIDGIGGDVEAAIRSCRESNPEGLVIEVEVRNQTELDAALRANPDIILLDNYAPEMLKEAVRYAKQKQPNILLEASGGITETNLHEYAATGVERVSLGALTHSVRSVDLSLRIC